MKENDENIEKIIDKFQQLNPNIKFNKDNLKNELNAIYNNYDKIKNEKDEDITNLCQNNNTNIDYFFIAKMINNNEKCFNFIPRKIQIISLLYFLKKDEEIGLIQQINTGEGKSIIIAFLAVYIAIKKNKKIDIITSSSILAKRDSKLFEKFYSLFNLTVGYTSDHNDEIKENKIQYKYDSYKCYDANIVYGDTLSFEGDILRTYFLGIKGRGRNRMYDCIIIDEIDNIALDNLKNTTELFDSFRGYKFLEYIYLFIYKKLKEITNKKDEKYILNNREDIIKQLTEESEKEFKDLKKLREEKYIFIPEHLDEYIKKRLNDWCESAYIAKFYYQNNQNYITKIDKEYKINIINPIDFYNTGVTQENSVWSGLHQFLQIKEKQMISEENLSSCYMSNLNYFQKYIKMDENKKIIENNIYGLTGTIGSRYNIETLEKLYSLQILFIPPFKESLLNIEKTKTISINDNEKENKNKKKNINIEYKWFNEIEKTIISKIEKGRAVLVIFQFISQAERMYSNLKNKGKPFSEKNLILYSRSDSEQGNFLEKIIEPGKIILSTNLSGRGTDIRISQELNKNGGLHVILTYEPFNKRIEDQAFGRAGRKGENGSAGKIIISSMTEEEINNKINKREEEESKFLIEVYSEKINVFEKIFDKFSKFLNEKYKITNDIGLLLDLKERWGIFLIKNDLNNIEKKYKKNKEPINYSKIFKNIEENYNKFQENLNEYYFENELMFSGLENTIDKANNFFYNRNKNKYEFMNPLYLIRTEDIEKINKAITKSPNLSIGGNMFIIIENIKKLNENKNNEKEYHKIISDIETKIEKLIGNLKLLLKQFETYQTIIGFLGYNKNNLEIYQQNEQKIFLMNLILDLMENNKNKFNEFKNKENSNISAKRISIKKLIKSKDSKDSKYKKINELVIEYFREYGLCLFELNEDQINENNCFIS